MDLLQYKVNYMCITINAIQLQIVKVLHLRQYDDFSMIVDIHELPKFYGEAIF